MPHIAIIIGSAPDAVRSREFDLTKVSEIVVINNAWQVRDDWTHLVCAGDFPEERRTDPGVGQKLISFEQYVPANNRFGGVVYAGGTMAFSTAYWVLAEFQPDVIAFCGVDMMYKSTPTGSHFYGDGGWDPLRDDVTLRSLEAKANRFMLTAAQQNCLCVNLSIQPKSRLTFPRLSAERLSELTRSSLDDGLQKIRDRTDDAVIEAACREEARANCFVESGDYWNFPDQVDPEALTKIDDLHLKGVQLPIEL